MIINIYAIIALCVSFLCYKSICDEGAFYNDLKDILLSKGLDIDECPDWLVFIACLSVGFTWLPIVLMFIFLK